MHVKSNQEAGGQETKTHDFARPNRKTKRRKGSKGSKGSTQAAPVTTASPEHLTTAESSGLLASGQPQIEQGSLSECDIKLSGEDHEQGPTPPLKAPLENGLSELSSYDGGASTTETLQATALHAAGEWETAAGTEGSSLPPFSAPSLNEGERVAEEFNGGASGGARLEPASAVRSDHCHHEEVLIGSSAIGKSYGRPDSGGRTGSKEEATKEKIDGRHVAETTAPALTVRLQEHGPNKICRE